MGRLIGERHAQIRNGVACPWCHVPAGERCWTGSGKRRWRIWANHLQRITRYRAYFEPDKLGC